VKIGVSRIETLVSRGRPSAHVALRLIKEIFDAAKSNWNFLNIRYGIAHERRLICKSDQTTRYWETVNQRRDECIRVGEQPLYDALNNGKAEDLLEDLFLVVSWLRGSGLMDESY
jgi:hypothetical protein